MVNKCSPSSALTCQRVANDEETNAYEGWPALVEIAGCFPLALSWWPPTSEGFFPRREQKVSAVITGCTNKAYNTWLLEYYSSLSLRVLFLFFVFFFSLRLPQVEHHLLFTFQRKAGHLSFCSVPFPVSSFSLFETSFSLFFCLTALFPPLPLFQPACSFELFFFTQVFIVFVLYVIGSSGHQQGQKVKNN